MAEVEHLMILMTDEEVRAHDELVSKYRQSNLLVDRIAAVLMDTAIASSGAPEQEARIKAAAILELLRVESVLKPDAKPGEPP